MGRHSEGRSTRRLNRISSSARTQTLRWPRVQYQGRGRAVWAFDPRDPPFASSRVLRRELASLRSVIDNEAPARLSVQGRPESWYQWGCWGYQRIRPRSCRALADSGGGRKRHEQARPRTQGTCGCGSRRQGSRAFAASLAPVEVVARIVPARGSLVHLDAMMRLCRNSGRL